ncbi:MAG TPA: M20/M25/M40 family metallo-hydrolase [Bryobacteraceae bacterium]|jgi:acetylornithine deacetylase/succinyl-diaminopimelate desuccinylase-like protein|nr:M20/M25/M40 family metallo-hydrolase [Bryobacteraceae bacterium]
MRPALGAGIAFLLCTSAFSQLPPERQLARDVLEQLININTTDSVGDNTKAAEAMAERFRAAGFPAQDVQVLIQAPRKGNLVVRYRGTGHAKPIVFLAHLDVVEAKREDWSVDPFHFLEKDGYFYGRGTEDDKSGDAELVANFLRLKGEGFRPHRDLILALTADEEGGHSNGAEWLLKNHRDLVDAEFCVNTDAGGGQMQNGKRIVLAVQAAEKTYLSFKLEVRNKGGHSSLPVPDNAIYRLADGLAKLEAYRFPVNLNPVSRQYFERMAEIAGGQTGKDMKAILEDPPLPGPVSRLSKTAFFNAMMRTTCVPTELTGGHAENALPQSAVAIVNCRLVPTDTPENVQSTLTRLVHDRQISITQVQPALPGPASPIPPALMQTLEQIARSLWPGVPVAPVMETGATDGKYFRLVGIPTYGVSGLFGDVNDVRAHGRDERIGVEAFYQAVDFYYRLIRALAE